MKNAYRPLFLTILILGSTSCLLASSQPADSTAGIIDKASAILLIEDGRTLFSEGKTRSALTKFREASNKDPYSWKALYWISKCHYLLDNYGYALKYATYAKEAEKDNVDGEVYLILGIAHHRLGNLDTALVNYTLALEKMKKRRAKETNVQQYIDECAFAMEALKKGPTLSKSRVPGINSGFDDYNVVILGEGKSMLFTSRRNNTTGGGMNPDDERYFEDTYKATFDHELGEWSNITNELGKVNSSGFDAVNYVSPDNLTAIITLNNTATGDKNKTRGSDICEMKRNNKGSWNRPQPIDNNTINTSFFEGSATLTDDGNTMYFVTDRKGDKSSTDIYVVEKVGKSWGKAKPLPKSINTEGRETTPFITPDGRFLFFSSDGHLGMGGLDIYVVENKGGSWGKPINLGAGINTVTNDSHFVYSEKLKKAFVCGYEIVGNKASLDIYEIDVTHFEIPTEK